MHVYVVMNTVKLTDPSPHLVNSFVSENTWDPSLVSNYSYYAVQQIFGTYLRSWDCTLWPTFPFLSRCQAFLISVLPLAFWGRLHSIWERAFLMRVLPLSPSPPPICLGWCKVPCTGEHLKNIDMIIGTPQSRDCFTSNSWHFSLLFCFLLPMCFWRGSIGIVAINNRRWAFYSFRYLESMVQCGFINDPLIQFAQKHYVENDPLLQKFSFLWITRWCICVKACVSSGIRKENEMNTL